MQELIFRTVTEDETKSLGAQLGSLLKNRGKPIIVCLFGNLGAGKTTFIKGFASAFGIPERNIGSASYVIVAEYETSPPFYHMDLYRLGAEACEDDIGLWEYIESNAIVVIEWAERLGETPEGAISIKIDFVGSNHREIRVSGVTDKEWKDFAKLIETA